jgi:hypothetical protein
VNTHPPLNPGERFCGNVRDGESLPVSLQGLEVSLRKPAFEVTGKPLPGYSAIVLTVDGLAEYNQRQERRLSEIRKGGAR